jgi:hypothetical protein
LTWLVSFSTINKVNRRAALHREDVVGEDLRRDGQQ